MLCWWHDAKNQLIGIDSDAGKGWRQMEKEAAEYESMKWSDSITSLMDMNLSKLWEIVKDRGVWL